MRCPYACEGARRNSPAGRPPGLRAPVTDIERISMQQHLYSESCLGVVSQSG